MHQNVWWRRGRRHGNRSAVLVCELLVILFGDGPVSHVEVKGNQLCPKSVKLSVGLSERSPWLRYDDIISQSKAVAIESNLPLAHETEIVDTDRIGRAWVL